MSRFRQTGATKRVNPHVMAGLIQIMTGALDGHDGAIVTFSDGTIAGYVVEELLVLRQRLSSLGRWT